MPSSPRPAMDAAVVAWSTGAPLHIDPRGQRAHHLERGLAAFGAVERVGADGTSAVTAGDTLRATGSRWRAWLRGTTAQVLLDKHEVEARLALARWRPEVDVAVLVGFPFSPLPFAARRLAERGIPYVLDVGDPWVLTNPAPETRGLARRRAARLEAELWRKAAGGILTTRRQADAIRALAPDVPLLVRPNGYTPAPAGAVRTAPRTDRVLRLAHFGSLYGERVGFRPFLDRLLAAGPWERVVLHQFGADWERLLPADEDRFSVVRQSPQPWAEIVSRAHEFDAAVVIGWRDPARMPSKVLQYLTLPIPRIALVNSGDDDSLAHYTRPLPGWAVVGEHDDGALVAGAVRDLTTRSWTPQALAPPSSESWEAIEQQLARFVLDAATGRRVA